jgi:hypothetical protein
MRFFGVSFTKICVNIPFLKNIALFVLCNDYDFPIFSGPVPQRGFLLELDNKLLNFNNSHFRIDVNIIRQEVKDFSGSRSALIAHWDPQKIIDPYVSYYAQELKKIGYFVVLCSANAVLGESAEAECFDAIVHRRNEGYDFASWKAAFEAFPSLFEANEILLTNDSIFGPIGDISVLYESMRPIECDFWGITGSEELRRLHLQSYFLVLYKKTVSHPVFIEFLESVGYSNKYEDSVAYEVAFTGILASKGLRCAARFSPDAFITKNINPTIIAWKHLLNTGSFPFVKRRLLNAYLSTFVSDFLPQLSAKGYPTDLIFNYAKRINLKANYSE